MGLENRHQGGADSQPHCSDWSGADRHVSSPCKGRKRGGCRYLLNFPSEIRSFLRSERATNFPALLFGGQNTCISSACFPHPFLAITAHLPCCPHSLMDHFAPKGSDYITLLCHNLEMARTGYECHSIQESLF